VLPHGLTYNQGSRVTTFVSPLLQQKSLKLFLSNISFLSVFVSRPVTTIFIYSLYSGIFFLTLARQRCSHSLYEPIHLALSKINNQRKDWFLFSGQISKNHFWPDWWAVIYLWASTGKEHEELTIAGLRIRIKKISNSKQDWTLTLSLPNLFLKFSTPCM
jgi:hypothetical protein